MVPQHASNEGTECSSSLTLEKMSSQDPIARNAAACLADAVGSRTIHSRQNRKKRMGLHLTSSAVAFRDRMIEDHQWRKEVTMDHSGREKKTCE